MSKKSIMNTVADQLQKLSIECYNQIIFFVIDYLPDIFAANR
jgi:hypothetical protein